MQFDPLGAPLSKFFEHMCKSGHLKLLDPTPYLDPLPKNWNTNLYCLFHQRTGHSNDECTRLKHEIQDLIDNDVIPKPRLTNQPNVHQNPLLNYQRTPPPNQINFIEVIQEDWVLGIDDEAWDNLEGKAHNTSWYMEDISEIEEESRLMRGGRHFKPAYQEEDYPRRDPPPIREADKAKTPKETEKDRVLAHLKKTLASISIWGLIMASQKHRDAILEALAGKEVPMDTIPKQILSIMGLPSSSLPRICHPKEEITIELSM